MNKPSTPRENNQLNFICHHSIRVNEHTHNNQPILRSMRQTQNVEAKKKCIGNSLRLASMLGTCEIQNRKDRGKWIRIE